MENAAAAPPSAQVVANAFVQQYFHILHKSPELGYRFYQDISKLGRPEDDGSMSFTTTMKEIDLKILSLGYNKLKAVIKSVDAQDSYNGGVNVLVTGYLTGTESTDNVARHFSQSFFLAPQDKGYFVLNDIFRYVDVANNDFVVLADGVEPPVTSEQVVETAPLQEIHISEEAAPVAEEATSEEVIKPQESEEAPLEHEYVLVPVEVREVQDPPQLAAESSTKSDDVPKKSYASIVMHLKQNSAPFSSPVPAPRKSQPRNLEQQTKPSPPPAPAVDSVFSNSESAEIVDNHEEEVEGYSIYIKSLPMNATPAMVEEAFKDFGTIRNGGVQVRSHKGFCYGFVEFEVPDAVQKAIEASPVVVGGRRATVEEKRSTYSRVNRGRFPTGRVGGFRNEGSRGRGAYGGGGRGYSRGGDFNGGARGDFGSRGNNRGGSANRGGGDGYQRADNNGGRMNRGVSANGPARNMVPRVPVTA